MTNTLNPNFTMTGHLPGFVNDSVLDMIGNTPMVDVSNLSPNPEVRILAKMEMQNPFGSVKDRIAKSMIETAEKEGRLLPGQTILEPSSGNTGIALAAIAGIKGYPIKIMMPTSVSIERRQMLEVFGAELILTPGERGLETVRSPVRSNSWRSIPSGTSRTSTPTTPTRVRITREPVPRSSATCPR